MWLSMDNKFLQRNKHEQKSMIVSARASFFDWSLLWRQKLVEKSYNKTSFSSQMFIQLTFLIRQRKKRVFHSGKNISVMFENQQKNVLFLVLHLDVFFQIHFQNCITNRLKDKPDIFGISGACKMRINDFVRIRVDKHFQDEFSCRNCIFFWSFKIWEIIH